MTYLLTLLLLGFCTSSCSSTTEQDTTGNLHSSAKVVITGRRKENASVVFLSSTSATISPPSVSVYSARKAAINSVMKISALELAPRKIRVNTVSPGPVATEIMSKIGLDRDLEEQIINSISLSRFGEPNEVANLIIYLSGDNASFIKGSNFLIDGGQSV